MNTYSQNGIFKSYKLFWKNAFNWNGRTRRSDFWGAWLVNLLICIGLVLLFGLYSLITESTGENTLTDAFLMMLAAMFIVFSLATRIASIGLCIRRLHDTGKSGFYYLFSTIPYVGSIIVLVFLCQDSQPGANQYGPSTKYYDEENVYAQNPACYVMPNQTLTPIEISTDGKSTISVTHKDVMCPCCSVKFPVFPTDYEFGYVKCPRCKRKLDLIYPEREEGIDSEEYDKAGSVYSEVEGADCKEEQNETDSVLESTDDTVVVSHRVCPNCNNEFDLTQSDIEWGDIICPYCKAYIDLDNTEEGSLS